MDEHILIIEIDTNLRAKLTQHIRQEGFRVLETSKEREALSLLADKPIAIALIGLKGLKRDGVEILRTIRLKFPHVKAITINSAEQFDLSLEVMRLGAYDDFLIPFEIDSLLVCINKALETGKRERPKVKKKWSTPNKAGGEA